MRSEAKVERGALRVPARRKMQHPTPMPGAAHRGAVKSMDCDVPAQQMRETTNPKARSRESVELRSSRLRHTG